MKNARVILDELINSPKLQGISILHICRIFMVLLEIEEKYDDKSNDTWPYIISTISLIS